MTTRRFLPIAEDAAKQAGAILRQKGRPDLSALIADLDRDVKLGADLEAEKAIVEVLIEHTPFDVLSEERGLIERNQDPELLWIVDPLDGTFNYQRGLPFSCVSVALWRRDEPVLGVIHDFWHDRTFSGVVGTGAVCNGEPIHVSAVERAADAALCTGFPVATDFASSSLTGFVQQVQGFKKVRLLGSAALSLALLATGSVDAYCENDIRIWDVAAGIALVKAAGGDVLCTRRPAPHTVDVVAHNGRLAIEALTRANRSDA